MEFYISPQSGQFYMINVLENQWLSVTYCRYFEVLWRHLVADICINVHIFQSVMLKLKQIIGPHKK